MSILKSWDVDTKNFVCLPLIKKLAVFQPAWSFVWHNLVNGNLKLCQVIVSTGDWLWKPANIKVENSGAVVYVGSSLTMHNPLFLVHKLWLNKLTWHFYWSVSSKWQECYGTLSTVMSKKANKNIVTGKSNGCHNHSTWKTTFKFCSVLEIYLLYICYIPSKQKIIFEIYYKNVLKNEQAKKLQKKKNQPTKQTNKQKWNSNFILPCHIAPRSP